MNEDKIIQKLIEHDEQFEDLKGKINDLPTRQEFLQKEDEIIKILNRLDQERIFTMQAIKRIEVEVEQHSQEIKQIKQQLKLA